jgi:hypothetical protein
MAGDEGDGAGRRRDRVGQTVDAGSVVQRRALQRGDRSMLRAETSVTVVDCGPLLRNGIGRKRPARPAQMRGDRRMAAERAGGRIEGGGHRLPDVPVWNERQHVGSVAPFAFELTGDDMVPALKNPAQQVD